MFWNRLFKAALIGVVLSAPIAPSVSAQSVLKTMRGATSDNISVSVNRAVVMEADRPFAELSVANPGIADIATLGERTIYVLGKAPGRTTLTILGPEGDLITNVDVVVTPDLAEFKERLREILPREPIEVRTANDGVILSGTVSGARKVSRALELAERYAPGRVTNLMMVGGSQQVMLKVRFAEMSRDVSKNLNSSGVLSTVGPDGFATVAGGPTDPAVLSGAGGGGSVPLSFDGGGAVLAGFTLGDMAVNMLIEALETKGMARTLAEPNLVAISGESASFLAGGEFPFPTVQGANQSNAVSIEWREFGVRLNFTPSVTNIGNIRLDIAPEVSSLDFAGGLSISGWPFRI